MSPHELERKHAPERDARHVRGRETQRRQEPRETVGVVGEAERLWWIRGPTRPRGVPGDDGELVGESLELRAPRRHSVSEVSVEKHERRPRADALVGDLQPVDLGRLHGVRPAP